MLNGEQPHADDRGDHHHWKVDHKNRREADDKTEGADQRHQRGIEPVNSPSLFRPFGRRVERHAIEDDEHQRRQHDMREKRVSRQPVEKALPACHRIVFRNRQARGVDVASGFPLVEIVPDRMMTGVLAAPIRVWRQRQDAAQPADQIVRPARFEERAVPAIVLDDEDAHEQRARRHCKQQRDKLGELQRPVHQRAGANKQTDGAQELEHARRHNGLLVRLDQ